VRAIVVGCGSSKIWDNNPGIGPVLARNAYISTLSRLSIQYAETVGVPWYILSAEYGFMRPDWPIPGPYETSFKDPSSMPIPIGLMREQARELGLYGMERIVCLAGPEYHLVLSIVFSDCVDGMRIDSPMKRLRIGERNQWLKQEITRMRNEQAVALGARPEISGL